MTALGAFRLRAARGAIAGAALSVGVTVAMVPIRGSVTRTTPALVLVLPIVVTALIAGRLPAVVTAVTAAAAFNLLFIPPYGTFKIDAVEDAVALAVFGTVALALGTLVASEGERRQTAESRAVELEVVNRELVALEEQRQRLMEEATRAAVLERVDEQRAALLRSVSHDLRTPLATIRAVVTDLLEGTAYDAATREELLTLVADEVERLDRLVSNLLSMSRIEAGALKPDRQAVAMDELVNDVIRRAARVVRGLRVQCELPADLPLVDGDYTQIEQVVTNLLENAARHAPPGSTIRIGAQPNRGRLELWVDDEGPGVARFEAQWIFEPFRRGQGSTSSGVGLAICKAIVEAHGGSIAVAGAPSGGARFIVDLPTRHD